jgi:hypothetical protein
MSFQLSLLDVLDAIAEVFAFAMALVDWDLTYPKVISVIGPVVDRQP